MTRKTLDISILLQNALSTKKYCSVKVKLPSAAGCSGSSSATSSSSTALSMTSSATGSVSSAMSQVQMSGTSATSSAGATAGSSTSGFRYLCLTQARSQRRWFMVDGPKLTIFRILDIVHPVEHDYCSGRGSNAWPKYRRSWCGTGCARFVLTIARMASEYTYRCLAIVLSSASILKDVSVSTVSFYESVYDFVVYIP